MFDGFLERSGSLLIVPILINFDIGASLEEAGEIFEGLGLLVKHDDIFHVLGVLMPVGRLQEVGSQDESLRTSGGVGKGNDLVGVSEFDQTLQRGNFVSNFEIQVGSEFKAALLPAFLSNSFDQLGPLGLVQRVGGLIFGNDPLDEVLLDGHIVLDAEVKGPFVLLGADEQRNRPLVFIAFQQRGYLGVDGCFVAAFDQVLLVFGVVFGLVGY